MKYKYDIGTIIKNVKYGELKILDQIIYGSRHIKGYNYRCLVCGNIDNISEQRLKQNCGCSVCAKQKALKGYNDLWSTHPHIAQLLKCADIGYQITHSSSKKQVYICKDCGYEKEIQTSRIIKQGISCPKCGDGISYPEKIMFNVLEQLNVEFEYQVSKKILQWGMNFRYDFYIPSLKCIIETHGLQHYKDINKNGFKSLEREKYNDRLKRKLALHNCIKKERYIVIDCRKSELEFIKNNILHSNLSNLLNLSKIDWLKCHEYSCTSLIKTACDYKKLDSSLTTTEIGKIMSLSGTTIKNYLKQGSKLGICNYDPKYEQRINGKKNGKLGVKRIICLNTKKIYNSITEVSNILNVSVASLTNCCLGKTYTSGDLNWMFYEDYLKYTEDYLNNKLSKLKGMPNSNPKKVICLNTNEIFDSITEATNKYKTKNIWDCCKNKFQYAGKLDDNTYLQWQYYSEWLKTPKKLLNSKEIKELRSGINNKKSVEVICINTKEIFFSALKGAEKFKCNHSRIIKCCKKKAISSGKHPETGEPLRWMYYEDYIKEYGEVI